MTIFLPKIKSVKLSVFLQDRGLKSREQRQVSRQ